MRASLRLKLENKVVVGAQARSACQARRPLDRLQQVDQGVSHAQLQQILTEQNLGREGRVDGNTIVQIGRLIGARYMVTGTIFDVRGDFRIAARLFDAETGQILRTQSVTGRLDNVFDLVTRLSLQLMRDANLPPLPREVMQQ